MVKSQSEHFSNKKRFNCQIFPEPKDTNLADPNTSQKSCKPTEVVTNPRRRFEMKREPISVPNFSTLILPTPVLTPVEATKLVYLDSDEEADLQDVSDVKFHPQDNIFYDTFKPACRDESYSSHLCASIYQNIPKSASVKFQCPELEEVSDENSTSDYASVEKMNKANRNHGGKATDEVKKGILKQTPTTSEGPFAFANPHYMGPDIQDFLKGNNRHSWNVQDSKAQQYAKLLNTPDSGVGDMSVSKSSNSRHMFLMEDLEMQQFDCDGGKNQIDLKRYPPNTLTLTHDNQRQKRTTDKARASSASRVEKIRDKIAPVVTSTELIDAKQLADDMNSNVQLYVFVIGGKEQGQITVFKRPISIWRLKLY